MYNPYGAGDNQGSTSMGGGPGMTSNNMGGLGSMGSVGSTTTQQTDNSLFS